VSGGGGAQGERYEKAAGIAPPDFGEMIRQVQKTCVPISKTIQK